MNKKHWRLIAATLLLCMVATACGVPGAEDPTQPTDTTSQDATTAPGSSAPAQPSGGDKTLRLSMTSEPSSMDPHDGSTVATSYVRNAIYEGLLVWKKGELAPGAAESWDISPDGLTYTFKLRENNTWWDGETVTAQHFEDGIIRLIDPNGPNGSYAFYGYMLQNGEAFHMGEITDRDQVGVKALDTFTLEIKLNEPVPYFLSLHAAGFFFPIRQEIADEHGISYGTSDDKVMGNGPFILENWAHESEINLVRNPSYWNAAEVKLDRVEIYIVGDGNTVLNMYEAGDLDFAFIPSEYVPKYTQSGEANFFEGGVEWWLEFNLESSSAAAPFLANADFRKAIGYALDRQAYVNAVYNNGSKPALRYTPDVMMLGDQPWGDLYPMQWYDPGANIAKAEEHLEKALATLGKTRADIPAIGFLTDDTAQRKLSAEALQDMLKQNLDIDLEITLVQSKNRYAMMTNGDFDIVFAGYGPDYNDPNAWLERLLSTSGLNDTNFRDAEYDQLIADAAKEVDQQKRGEILYKAEQIMQERGPLVPVFMVSTAYAIREGVVDVTFGIVSDMEANYVYADIVN